MKEILILIIVAVSSLFILAYSVHMFIGGLVTETTETWAITGAVIVGVCILAFLGWDIVKQRRRN